MNPLRLRIALFFVFAALAGLSVRLLHVQVLNGMTYQKLARRQFLSQTHTMTHRGDILDRNGSVLATTIEADSLYLNPSALKEPERAAEFLQSVLGIPQEKIDSAVHSGRHFVWLKRRMTPQQIRRVKRSKIAGLGLVEEQNRYYPNGSMACHLVGSVGLDNRGLSGIEQSFDGILKGTERVTRKLRDGKGRRLPGRYDSHEGKERVPAHSTLLTVDRSLQYITDHELRSAVRRSRAQAGVAILQDPKNGEILALSAWPDYDPNPISRGRIPKGFSNSLMQNSAVSRMYEPGSTFKVVALSAALELKKVDLDEIIDCEKGAWKIPGGTIRDHEKHGELSFVEVMYKSSNIGTAKIAKRLGEETLYRFARSFGFGTRTGLSVPGESSGLLRTPREWSGLSLPSISYGQEVGVTPVQLINAFSVIANGGLLMEPKVVRGVCLDRGEDRELRMSVPRAVRRVISEKTSRAMRQILQGVVEKGTGGLASVSGYTVAGKTGTAQKIDPETGKYHSERHVASFCGFMPASDPKLVCLVILDEPEKDYWGGTTAAPAFASIMGRSAQILGIPPDRPVHPVVVKGNSEPSGATDPSRSLMKRILAFARLSD